MREAGRSLLWFVSYNRGSVPRPLLERWTRALAAHGDLVWCDVHSLVQGDWSKEVIRAIETCDVFVALATPEYWSSGATMLELDAVTRVRADPGAATPECLILGTPSDREVHGQGDTALHALHVWKRRELARRPPGAGRMRGWLDGIARITEPRRALPRPRDLFGAPSLLDVVSGQRKRLPVDERLRDLPTEQLNVLDGRDRELDQLSADMQRSNLIVGVHAPPGRGKTALLRRFVLDRMFGTGPHRFRQLVVVRTTDLFRRVNEEEDAATVLARIVLQEVWPSATTPRATLGGEAIQPEFSPAELKAALEQLLVEDRVLLVIDELEHAIERGSALVDWLVGLARRRHAPQRDRERLLQRAPQRPRGRILVSSTRAPASAAGVSVRELPPLAFPDALRVVRKKQIVTRWEAEDLRRMYAACDGSVVAFGLAMGLRTGWEQYSQGGKLKTEGILRQLFVEMPRLRRYAYGLGLLESATTSAMLELLDCSELELKGAVAELRDRHYILLDRSAEQPDGPWPLVPATRTALVGLLVDDAFAAYQSEGPSLDVLDTLPLMQASARGHIGEWQRDNVLLPLRSRIDAAGDAAEIQARLEALLLGAPSTKYRAANLFHLMTAVDKAVVGVSFDHQTLRDVALDNVAVRDCSFVGTTLLRCELPGYVGQPMCAALAPDGDTFVIGENDGNLSFWDHRGKMVRDSGFVPSTDAVNKPWAVGWAPDSATVYVARDSGAVEAYRWPGLETRWKVPAEGSEAGFDRRQAYSIAAAVDPADGTVFVVHEDRTLRALREGEDLACFDLPKPANAVAVHPRPDGLVTAGDLVAAGSDRYVVIVRWHEGRFSEVLRLEVPLAAAPKGKGRIRALVWHPTLARIAWAGDGVAVGVGQIDVTRGRVSNRQILQDKEAHAHTIRALAWHPGGDDLVSTDERGRVIVWDVRNPFGPTPGFRSLPGHTDKTWSVSFDAEGRFLTTASLDLSVRVWQPKDWQLISKLQAHINRPLQVTSVPGLPGFAASVWEDGGLRVFDVRRDPGPEGPEPVSEVSLHEGRTRGLAVVDRVIYTAGMDEALQRVALTPDGVIAEDGRQRTQLPLAQVWALAAAPWGGDGSTHLVVLGDTDGRILAYRVGSADGAPQMEPAPLGGHGGGAVRSIAITAGGRRVAAGDMNGVVTGHDMAPDGTATQRFLIHVEPAVDVGIHAVSFVTAPDGSTRLVVAHDNHLSVYDEEGGLVVRRHALHEKRIRDLDAVDGGRALLSTGGDKEIRLLQVADLVSPGISDHDLDQRAPSHKLDEKRAKLGTNWVIAVAEAGGHLLTASENGQLRFRGLDLTRPDPVVPSPRFPADRDGYTARSWFANTRFEGVRLDDDRPLDAVSRRVLTELGATIVD